MDQLTPLFDTLQSLLESLGAGDTMSNLKLFLFLVIAVSVLVFTFTYLRISSRKNRRPARIPPPSSEPEGFDRFASILGKLERLEMESNNGRTELMRGNAFLRDRLEALEGQVSELSDRLRELDGKEGTPISEAASGFAARHGDDDVLPDGSRRSSSIEFFPEDILDRDGIDSEVITGPTEIEDITSEPRSLTGGLKKTRQGLFSKIRSLFASTPQLEEGMIEEVQALLIGADMGVKTVEGLIAELKESMRHGDKVTESVLFEMLRESVLTRLTSNVFSNVALSPQRKADGPNVVMMVGVNGVGKTTTTAKLAHQLKSQGAKVLLVAADTFRAAAVEQLKDWSERVGVDIVTGVAEAKPASVVFDALEQAEREGYDVVIVDTAGRLHTKSNLMQELEGIKNVMKKHQPDAPHETILVVDGVSGQNAVEQARQFHETTPLTGLVITKLDGTPKGGIVIAIKDELGVPIRYIGVGEGVEDLKEFDPEAFAHALFDTSDVSTQAAAPSENAKKRRRRRDTIGS